MIKRRRVVFIPAPMYRAVARRGGLADIKRLLEAGQGPAAIAASVEACLGRRVEVVTDPTDLHDDPAERGWWSRVWRS